MTQDGGHGGPNALTCIHRRIHCAATPDASVELERIELEAFLEALAEVAMAVSKRKLAEQGRGPQE